MNRHCRRCDAILVANESDLCSKNGCWLKWLHWVTRPGNWTWTAKAEETFEDDVAVSIDAFLNS